MAFNKKQKLRDNIEAMRIAFTLDREQRKPTERERLLLGRYCGFGGLKCILNPARELTDAARWPKSDLELFAPTVELYRLIRENSKDETEYKRYVDAMKQSVLTAFYTPKEITGVIADALHDHHIRPAKVLEPSAGVGAFVDAVLDNRPDADVMAFEKDLMTGKILTHLHPDQKMRVQGFEKIEKPFMGQFDLAVSNIPFGDVAVFDPEFEGGSTLRKVAARKIHNYFFLKGLDAVKEGGIVAFITSQGVLNTPGNDGTRHLMMKNADLVSAVRLPNNLFTDHANTEVGCDLLILRKHSGKTDFSEDEELLLHVEKDNRNNTMTNGYFLRHPERIIHTKGKLDTDPYGKPAMVYLHEGGVSGIAEDLGRVLGEDFRARLTVKVQPEGQKEQPQQPQEEVVEAVEPEMVQEERQVKPPSGETVQLTLFDLWEYTVEEQKATTKPQKAKAKSQPKKAVRSGNAVQPKTGIPQPPKAVEPPKTAEQSQNEAATTSAETLPGDIYADINWEENPPINGFYETMMSLTPERRVALRQKAEEHRQEQLRASGQKDTLDPKFIPPMGTAATSAAQAPTQPDAATLQRQAEEQRQRKEEAERRKQEALLPRPYDRPLELHHRDGSMVIDRNNHLGVLQDLTPYGATFRPLDLQGYQKEKAMLYVSLRDAYERLYRHEAEHREEDSMKREHLNACYDEFVLRYGNLNAKQNVKMLLMDASGRDMLSLERTENGQFVKADIFERPVSFSVETDVQADSPMEALSASLNKYGGVDLGYMRTVTDSTEEELLNALQGRIFYNPLAGGYEIKDRFIAGNVIEKAESIEAWIGANPDGEHLKEAKEALQALKEAEPQRITFEELDFNFGEGGYPRVSMPPT